MEALSKELAAQGGKTPNKIPVSMAMARLEQEFHAPPPLAVAPDDHSSGAEIFRRIVGDPSRAALVITESESWRTGPKELAASILPGIPANGFSVSAATLTSSEWKEIHSELIRLMEK